MLGKAVSYAESRKFDVNNFCAERLFPDMLPLAKQVQIACDTAKGAAARLAGIENPKHEDTEQTPAKLKWTASTRAKSAKCCSSRAARKTRFNGLQYLLGFAYPNFYRHHG